MVFLHLETEIKIREGVRNIGQDDEIEGGKEKVVWSKSWERREQLQ